MTITWRLFLFSGLISLINGILNITSLLEARTDGLNVWGYILLFWGITAIMSALNQFKNNAIIKVVAAAGILLNGSLGIYTFLFPGNGEAGGMDSSSVLYALASFVAALCCMIIIGKRLEDTSSKSVIK